MFFIHFGPHEHHVGNDAVLSSEQQEALLALNAIQIRCLVFATIFRSLCSLFFPMLYTIGFAQRLVLFVLFFEPFLLYRN